MSRELRDRLETLQVELAACPAERERLEAERHAVEAELEAVRKERAEVEADIIELELSFPSSPRRQLPLVGRPPMMSPTALLVALTLFTAAVLLLRACFR